MAADRLTTFVTPAAATRSEWAARLFVVLLLVGLPLALLAAPQPGAITLHATMPENGGWLPGHLSARAGEPLHLRLTSDDVIHGFAVGVGPDGKRPDIPEVDVKPGQVTELSLTFDQPGTYTFYCTRWCGPNHWRMRGTIEVRGGTEQTTTAPADPPRYVTLGLDIDAPHPAPVTPAGSPSATRGRDLNLTYPKNLAAQDAIMTQSPAEVWLALRSYPAFAYLDDAALWDAVAALWQDHGDASMLAQGEALYAQNCAACHGETGAGDGVFATTGPDDLNGQAPIVATDFTDPALLGASNALLLGKIQRGGMGTGMPAWGTIFGDEELQALLAYLWTFQFPREER